MKGFYLSAGLVEDPQHCARIGPALWEFEWLIAHETREAGRVLNGAPITAKRIAASLGRHENTVTRNLARLEREQYIERFRKEGDSGRPYQYRISNSKKWVHTENGVKGFTPKMVGPSHTKRCDLHTENGVSLNNELDKVDKVDRGAGPRPRTIDVVNCEIIPPDLHGLQCAAFLIQAVQESGYELPDNLPLREAITRSHEALVAGGKSPPGAHEYLMVVTMDAIERGQRIDKFFFQDAKWRGNGATKPSAAAARAERNKQNIIDGLAADNRRRAESERA